MINDRSRLSKHVPIYVSYYQSLLPGQDTLMHTKRSYVHKNFRCCRENTVWPIPTYNSCSQSTQHYPGQSLLNNFRSVKLVALVRRRNLLVLVPLHAVSNSPALRFSRGTYVFVNTPINPPPPVGNAVLRIRHVCARVEAPFRAGLAPNLPAVAKQGPDVLGPVGVPGVMLLLRVSAVRSPSLPAPSSPGGGGADLVHGIDQGEHGLGIPINDKRAVELVSPDGRLLDRDGGVGLAELGRLLQAAEVLASNQVRRRGETGDGGQDGHGQDVEEPHC
jgi:hypothetical protein